MNDALAEAVGARLGERVASAQRVAGGSINDAWHLELVSGASIFVKARGDAEPAEFQAEAAGLRWLAAVAGGCPVPEVLAVGEFPAWLALEWIEPGALAGDGAEAMGRGLAAIHRSGARSFGALPPDSPDEILRIGSVEIPLAESEVWSQTYAEQLLLPLVERTVRAGTLAPADAQAVERVCSRIDDLAGPKEAPSCLHGDLWGGNVMAAKDGRAWLIDPAAYGGHREVDLAMLRLFGSPGERVFNAYDEAFPLATGHEERVALYQLLPLLIHALLFGGSYGASAGDAARRYA